MYVQQNWQIHSLTVGGAYGKAKIQRLPLYIKQSSSYKLLYQASNRCKMKISQFPSDMHSYNRPTPNKNSSDLHESREWPITECRQVCIENVSCLNWEK